MFTAKLGEFFLPNITLNVYCFNLFFQNPPFDLYFKGPNGTYKYNGPSLEIIKWLSAKFNFTLVHNTHAKPIVDQIRLSSHE